MSCRDRAEEALAKHFLSGRGASVYFVHGDPVVTMNGRKLPAFTSARVWKSAKEHAEAQYEVVLRTVDWNRAVLEALGAYLAAADEHDVTMFGSDAKASGQALKAALATRDTMPDWFRARRLESDDPAVTS